jgi:hypothetical protein
MRHGGGQSITLGTFAPPAEAGRPCPGLVHMRNREEHVRPHSRGAMRPSCAWIVPPNLRAWGMPGVSCARSPVCKGRKHTGSDRRYSRKHPAFPHAMVLTVSFGLSPVIGLVCHRRLRSCLPRLDAGVEASGPHDFAVRTSALSSLAPPASTASRPAFVTIAIRPSRGRDGWGYRSDLGQAKTEIFLQLGLDAPNHVEPTGEFSSLAHAARAGNPSSEIGVGTPDNGPSLLSLGLRPAPNVVGSAAANGPRFH